MREPNIILIVCDTLRKDTLGIYGGDAKTPFLNMLAKDSMVYNNAIAPSPWTFPSHVSIFTGMYPSEHGVHETRTLKLFDLASVHKDAKHKRIAEFLQEHGYRTIGISNNIMISRFTAFDTGFDYYTNIETDLLQSKEAKEALALGADITQVAGLLIKKGKLGDLVKYTREFLRIRRLAGALKYPFNKGAELTNNLLFNTNLQPKFFLFLNFMETHEPYKDHTGKEKKTIWDDFTGIKRIKNSEIENLKRRYVLEAEYLDRNIGNFIEMLKLRDLYDNSMIIVTADHGQAFREHGFMYHGVYLYDEISRVPLIIKYPNGKKYPVQKGYQSLTNIFPLIKDMLNGKDDSSLTTEVAFAEAYGDDKILPKAYDSRKRYVLENHEKLRKAVYRKGFKLTINGTDGGIEEFMDGDKDRNIDGYKTEIRKLISEIRKFGKNDGMKFPSLY